MRGRQLAGVGIAIVLVIAALMLAGAVAWLNLRDEDPLEPLPGTATAAVTAAGPELIARGAYLARAGNCLGCHTTRGGTPYAGGRGVPTPFGTVYAPNLTPDPTHGLGAWSAAEFWRALHNGRARDGRLLYPAFPYPNYTRITHQDSDAIYAFLRSLPPAAEANRPNTLQFPFGLQSALAIWRALYFRPAGYAPDPAHTAEWNRGAYLVEGLGHCNACHAARNALGATSGPLDLAGGLIPVQNWYAPSLTSAQEAGVADWELQDVVALLKTGVSARGSVSGPMTEVIGGGTQYLDETDLRAMAAYLKSLPQTPATRPAASLAIAPDTAAGADLYAARCAACHGDHGEGAPGAYPALAGNRAVTMATPANLVHIVLEGGFAPATAGNPRPYGMPPFATELNNEELALLLTYLRSSWGNQAAPVMAFDVQRFRSSAR
jgi:mono/diheme cytochrome c family protein